MNLSTEARVGAISLIGLLLLGYMIVYLGGISFGEKGYPVQAVFSEVGGLKEGNVVRYAGVDVGRVTGVRAGDGGVEVQLRINPGVKIPAGSKFTIGTDGLLGEKFVNIVPPRKTSGYLQPGATVAGEDPRGLDQLVSSADKTLVDLQKLIQSLNEVLGDDKVKAAMKTTALNAREITERLNEFSASLARMARNNEQDVNTMVGNLREVSANLKNVTARVDAMVAAVDNKGQTAKDLKETIQNLKKASVRVEKIAASVEDLVTDPETAKNIKETLRNARSVSEKANKMLTKIENVSVETGFEVLRNGHTDKYRSNADVRINTSPSDFAVIGVSGIGDNQKTNFQIGKGDANFAARAGIVEGKAGIGADTRLGKQLRLSLDVYDPNDVRVKLRTQYEIAPHTFIVGQTDSLNKQPSQNTYVGLRHTF
ncbi:MlaD family protein [Anaeroselena agilis]|uniref:MlaD family protein n=1 Tax=Anaeroselena agilis TaxID=3063788 RepID=A0ABU3P431_9FIRM|nr:MlaD family protein [Selenomonadales bacterium 4137-cl]